MNEAQAAQQLSLCHPRGRNDIAGVSVRFGDTMDNAERPLTDLWSCQPAPIRNFTNLSNAGARPHDLCQDCFPRAWRDIVQWKAVIQVHVASHQLTTDSLHRCTSAFRAAMIRALSSRSSCLVTRSCWATFAWASSKAGQISLSLASALLIGSPLICMFTLQR